MVQLRKCYSWHNWIIKVGGVKLYGPGVSYSKLYLFFKLNDSHDLQTLRPQTISAPVTSAPPTLRPLVISAHVTFRPQLYFHFCVCVYFKCYTEKSGYHTVVFHYYLMYTTDLRTKWSYYRIVIWVLQKLRHYFFIFILFIYLFIYCFSHSQAGLQTYFTLCLTESVM